VGIDLFGRSRAHSTRSRTEAGGASLATTTAREFRNDAPDSESEPSALFMCAADSRNPYAEVEVEIMRYGIRPSDPLEWFALYTKKIPVPILDVLLGPLQARVLMTAGKVGLLAALADGSAASQELAERLELDVECLGLVLRVLRAMGYVELRSSTWKLSKLGERYFGNQAEESYRAFVEYGPPQWTMIERLEQVLQSGKGIDFHATQTPEEWDTYQRAMFENASAFAWFVVDNLPVPSGAKSCLDLAGSHGFIGASLCQRHSGLRSTVLDLPPAVSRAKALAQQHGYGDRVSFREGDLLESDYGADHDVVLACNILHHFPAATNRAVLSKIKGALRPGGVVGIFDIETPALDAPPEAAADAFALYFRITSTSSCFRGSDYEAWLDECGFRSTRTVRSVKMPSRMLVLAER
jgi:2-polyprenyl-3-methyl-5-hydroxy-6-metoxy-1,4-benzoquinol methylase